MPANVSQDHPAVEYAAGSGRRCVRKRQNRVSAAHHDLGRAPIRTFVGQAPDQDANLFDDLRAASARAGAPAPVEAESGAMPADHGFGLENDENFGPTGPTTAEGNPEDPV